MTFIPIIHRLKQLSTLKHSCFSASFTLKHSCLSAETLLRSIYTYIYLYKKTCSWALQIVNNFFVNKLFAHFLWVMITPILLSGCYKQSTVNCEMVTIDISQRLATSTSPAEFYVCGNHQYPCLPPTAIWQADRTKNHTHQISIKRKGASHGKHQRKNQCLVK